MIKYENDSISENIEYYTNLFLFINSILQKSNESLTTRHLSDIKQLLLSSQSNPKIKEQTVFYLSSALSESIHIESSIILRYILKEVYCITYPIPDHYIFQTALNDSNYPSLFEDNIPELSLTDSQLASLLSKDEKTIKPFGAFFDSFTMTYPFNKDSARKIVAAFMTKSPKIRKHESLLLWFPEYFELLNGLIEDMFDNEKLFMPKSEKYYLGIMGASAIECDILQKELIKQFIIHGGDPKWISQGLSATPKKIKALGKINNILAHQPWKLKVSIITELNLHNNIDHFTQSCIILTLFHRIASLIKSLKVSQVNPNMTLKEITETRLFKSHTENLNVKKIYSELNHSEKSNERRQRMQQLSDIKTIKETNTHSNANTTSINESQLEKTTYSKYTSSDYCTIYQDFDTHSIQYLFNMEFSWENNGAYIINDYWSGFSDSFNNEFNYISQFTSHCFGSHECIADTTYFRLSIITYIEKIFGLCDETFDYSKTNKLIKKHIKSIIKNFACYPDIADLRVIQRSDFNDQDLLHIILLSLIAKQRAQLTYIAKVLNDLQKESH